LSFFELFFILDSNRTLGALEQTVFAPFYNKNNKLKNIGGTDEV
jgi:hypothetical protein